MRRMAARDLLLNRRRTSPESFHRRPMTSTRAEIRLGKMASTQLDEFKGAIGTCSSAAFVF